jgi:hypothetical protein
LIAVASAFLDQTRPDGGEYKHTKFSLAYLLDQPGPGHLFLAMYELPPVIYMEAMMLIPIKV